MDVDDFLAVASQQGLRLPKASADGPARAPEAMDALFHLPLLALAMMVIVRRSPFETATLGRRVAVLLAEHFSPLRRSPHGLVTSVTLLKRCADALAFLEASKLVTVSRDSRREVKLTPDAKGRVARAAREQTDLGFLVRGLIKNQGRVQARVGNDVS